jgi:hypothetical protein
MHCVVHCLAGYCEAMSREGLGVVVFPPAFDDDLCFAQRVKDFAVEPGLGKPDRSQEPRARINDLDLIHGHHTGQRRVKAAYIGRTHDCTDHMF